MKKSLDFFPEYAWLRNSRNKIIVNKLPLFFFLENSKVHSYFDLYLKKFMQHVQLTQARDLTTTTFPPWSSQLIWWHFLWIFLSIHLPVFNETSSTILLISYLFSLFIVLHALYAKECLIWFHQYFLLNLVSLLIISIVNLFSNCCCSLFFS